MFKYLLKLLIIFIPLTISAQTNIVFTESSGVLIEKTDLNGSNHALVFTDISSPNYVAYNPDTNRIIFASRGNLLSSRIDGSDLQLILNDVKANGVAVDSVNNKIFWTTTDDKVQKSNYDGSGLETLVDTTLTAPAGIAINTATQKVYIADLSLNKVFWMDADGGNFTELLDFSSIIGNVLDVAIDTINSKLFIALGFGSAIAKADLDGSNLQLNTISFPAQGLGIDNVSGKIYWTYNTFVRSTNLDGTGSVDTLADDMDGNFSGARDVAVDNNNNRIYIPDEVADDILTSDLVGTTFSSIKQYDFTPSRVRGLALDPTTQKIYWSDTGMSSEGIYRVNLDGTEAELLVAGIDSDSISIDYINRKIYWVDDANSKIVRSDFNGTNPIDIATNLGSPVNVAVDPEAGYVFWTELGDHPIKDKIGRAGLDGTSPTQEVVFESASVAYNPYGLALDTENQKVYWSTFTTSLIARADYDGSNQEDLFTGLPETRGVAVDPTDGKVYWVNRNSNLIQRGNSDGTGMIEDVVDLGHSTLENVLVINMDDCPRDPNKLVPGQCGCGVADTDADNDGIAACRDRCDNDSDKVTAGFCGCGVPDLDTDTDGTLDCLDACSTDPLKISAGICGCGVSDTDSDSDGTADCQDACTADSLKTSSGTCGCGVADQDTDRNQIIDCSITAEGSYYFKKFRKKVRKGKKGTKLIKKYKKHIDNYIDHITTENPAFDPVKKLKKAIKLARKGEGKKAQRHLKKVTKQVIFTNP